MGDIKYPEKHAAQNKRGPFNSAFLEYNTSAKVEVNTMAAFRSHVFQTAEKRKWMLVSNHLGAFKNIENQGSVTADCQGSIPHHIF